MVETNMLRLTMAGLVMLLVVGCHAVDSELNAELLPMKSLSPSMLPLTPLTLLGTMATLPQTKKLPTDHLLSWATGKDCSVLHYEKDGIFCQDPPRQVDRRNLYCTKTIGAVECHERPNPYYAGEQVLASPPPRMIDQN